jgi:hypothetical protein
MSFVTAESEMLAVCGMYGESAIRVGDFTISQTFRCALGSTPDSVGVQHAIRDVATAEPAFHMTRTRDDRSLPVQLWMATVPRPVGTP